MREREKGGIAGPLSTACLGAAPPVERGEGRGAVAVAHLEEEAFVGPAGAIVISACFRVDEMQGRRSRSGERVLVPCLHDYERGSLRGRSIVKW